MSEEEPVNYARWAHRITGHELRAVVFRMHASENRAALLVAVVGELAEAMPLCARCGVRAGVVMSRDRWWLCDGCWARLPWPEAEGQVDLRAWWAKAMAAMR